MRFIPTYVGHTFAGSVWACYNLRFIPTYVGHTSFSHPRERSPAVHPHIRGAYDCGVQIVHSVFGSSPHTWGIRYRANYCIGYRAVHPHIRGAYTSRQQAGEGQPGSSPHTWGILPCVSARPPWWRFIPTYVGHTRVSGGVKANVKVHPHIRGAYKRYSCTLFNTAGSSPHTWGIRKIFRCGRGQRWFIPTYVGHTQPTAGGGGATPVHPHIRGAYRLRRTSCRP